MSETTIAGVGVLMVLTLLLLAALHFYWALGGGWGRGAVLPERAGRPTFRPGRVGTAAVGVGLSGAALVLALRSGALSYLVGGPLVRWASWLITAAFLLRAVGDFRLVGLFRRERGTRFAYWDARLYTPLALALGLGAALIASGAG